MVDIKFHRAVREGDRVQAPAFGGAKSADLDGGVPADIDRGRIGQINARECLLRRNRKGVVRENELAGDFFGGGPETVADLTLDALQGLVLRRRARHRCYHGKQTERQKPRSQMPQSRGT
jgi:hypothetical protein